MPASVDPLIELSNLRFAQQRTGEAEEYLRRARVLARDDPTALHHIAEALRRGAGTKRRAPRGTKRWASPGPRARPRRHRRGLFDAGRHEEALESLARAVVLDIEPATAATAHYLAGRRCSDSSGWWRRPRTSRPPFGMIRTTPRRWTIWPCGVSGNRPTTRRSPCIESRRRWTPDNVTIHANIGVTLYYLGRHEEALASVEQVLRLDPDHELAGNLAAELRALTSRRVR